MHAGYILDLLLLCLGVTVDNKIFILCYVIDCNK